MTKEKKHDPFKKVTEQLPFYPDLTKEEQEPFYCGYVDEIANLGENPDPAKQRPVFILADVNTGEEVFCMQSYAVKKTIDAAKKAFNGDLTNVVFRFQFLGKDMVKGKPFNKFNGSYCTLEEYEVYLKSEEKPVKKVK